MEMDRVALRERMRSLTVGELRKIAENRGGVHDAGEVGAAHEELTSRFSVHHDGPLGKERGTDDEMPGGLRAVFYLAWCVAVLEILALAFFFSVSLTANVSIRLLIEAILRFGVPAAWAIWVAGTTRSDGRYARGLLLSLLSIALTVKITSAFLTQQFTYSSWIVPGALAVALCYVAFSDAVRRYYRAISDAD